MLLYSDAVISPAATGLIYTASSSRLSFGMARNRYLPAIFELLNARHVPLFSIVVATVLGFLFLLPFPSWQGLIKIITSATVLSYGLQPLALGALRRQVPDLKRPFRLPAAGVLAPVAFIVSNLIIYWGGWETNWKLMVAIGVGFGLLALNYAWSSPERRPTFDWRVAWWLVPYLAGLTVISFLGATDFDGRGVFPFGWDALVVAAFSVGIYALALRLRPPAEEAEQHIRQLSARAEAEEEVLRDEVPV